MMSIEDCNEKKKSHADDDCKQCAPTCLERPRYFCGQLLTDEDLNAEQSYQIEKNKLHNRYIHGWGVVSGLKVLCHPKCSPRHVLIEDGYAIDCCGNDIFVCKDEELDIIKKIKEIKKKDREDECFDDSVEEECKDREEKYCLVIKYCEEESRPITAFKKDEEGCNVKRCEPSRIMEGYTFELKECKGCHEGDIAKWTDILKDIWKDTAWEDMGKCKPIFSGTPTTKKEVLNATNHNSLFEAYCKARDSILSMANKTSNLARCDIKTELKDIEFPDPETENYRAKVTYAYRKLGALMYQIWLECVCLQLLYPSPECREDDKVILACITVQGERIKDICNLSRRQVMSFPKLFYWIPVNEAVRKFVNYLCCELDIMDLFPEPPVIEAAQTMVTINSKLMASSFATTSQNFISNLNAPGERVSGFIGRDLNEVEKTLSGKDITVARKIAYEPSLKNLPKNLSTLITIPQGSEVELLYSENKVVGIRLAEERVGDEGTMADIQRKYETLRADFDVVKSAMRRDLGSIIKLKANIEEAYQPLTIDLVKGLTEKMQPEAIKEVGDVREKELKEVGIKSVRDVLEAVPAEVSDATKEPIANATKYVDHAENLTMKVTTEVYNELKRAKVTEKKDLNKVDTQVLAKKLNLSERTVKKVISDIRKMR